MLVSFPIFFGQEAPHLKRFEIACHTGSQGCNKNVDYPRSEMNFQLTTFVLNFAYFCTLRAMTKKRP